MDIKSMLVKLAEEQADKMQEQAMEHLASDDMAEKIASAINKRIDIPFVSEEKEQIQEPIYHWSTSIHHGCT